MEFGIGTPEYTDRYILFAGGWKGYFFCNLSPNPVDARSNENCRSFFTEITLGTKVYPLEEY